MVALSSFVFKLHIQNCSHYELRFKKNLSSSFFKFSQLGCPKSFVSFNFFTCLVHIFLRSFIFDLLLSLLPAWLALQSRVAKFALHRLFFIHYLWQFYSSSAPQTSVCNTARKMSQVFLQNFSFLSWVTFSRSWGSFISEVIAFYWPQKLAWNPTIQFSPGTRCITRCVSTCVS